MKAPTTVLYRVRYAGDAHAQLAPASPDALPWSKFGRGSDSIRFANTGCSGLKTGELVRLRVERVKETDPQLA